MYWYCPFDWVYGPTFSDGSYYVFSDGNEIRQNLQ